MSSVPVLVGAAGDGRHENKEESVGEDISDRYPQYREKLKGWTGGLKRAKAAAKGDLSLKHYSANKNRWAPVGAFQGGGDPAVEVALGSEGFIALQVDTSIYIHVYVQI